MRIAQALLIWLVNLWYVFFFFDFFYQFKIKYDPATGTFKTAIGGVKNGTDVTTHTGQAYDEGDFRHNRFLAGKVELI